MNRVLGFAVVAVACVACGNSNKSTNNKIMLMPDAPTDTAPDAGPSQVTVEMFATPSLFMYRDGQGAWKTPTPDGQFKYLLDVTNDYEIVIVCANGGAFQAVLQAATIADGAMQFADCFAPTSGGTTVDVTGTMKQAGTIQIGDVTQSKATANWSFDLAVAPGTHDVVAYDTDTMYVNRSQDMTAATALGTLDVVASGTAMTAVPLVIGNVGSDTLGTELEWLLTNDFVFMTGTSATIETPPASLVMANDFEFLDVTATGTNTFRDGSAVFSGTDPGFTLPDPLTGVTLTATSTDVTATWGTLSTYDSLALYVSGGTTTAPQEQEVTVSQSWIQATSATHLTFDAMPPGYDASWHVDLTSEYTRELFVSTSSGMTSYDSGYFETVNGTGLRAPQQPSRARARALRVRARR